MSDFKIWECQVCNWIYDEAKGCPEEGIKPGTRWQDIPDDWHCPECGVGKADFDMLEVSQSDVSPPSEDTPAMQQQTDTTPMPKVAEQSPLIIIGSGLAAYQLLKEIRNQNSKLNIVLYTADDGSYYSKPQLSNGFSANKSAADLILFSAESMAQKYQAEINIYTAVTKIDSHNKCIHLSEGGTRSYSKLILALGAHSTQVPLAGNAVSKVHRVNDLQDYARFRTLLKPDSRILILGGGLIGCEFADDLTRTGHQVSVVDPLSGPLAGLLPEEASQHLHSQLQAAGIDFHFKQVVNALNHDTTHQVIAELQDVNKEQGNGKTITADIVLSAIGLRPNLNLAETAGIQCERGIVVNNIMQTSQPDIYALGDCAQFNQQVLPYIAPLNIQAKALAKTLCGDIQEVRYPVIPVMVKTKLCPVVVVPPSEQDKTDGQWLTDTQTETGVLARFVDASGQLKGYALTGDQCRFSNKLARQMSGPH